MVFLLSLEGDRASRFALPHGSLLRARPASSCTRCQTCPAPGPLKRAVGCSFPRVAAMPVSSRGPCGRRSWWCHTPLIDPGHPHACEAGRGHQMRPCRHGLIWDHTVVHVVASCRANLATVAPSTRNCRIAQRTAHTPKTRPGSTHLLAMLQERHRLAGAFAAHPAPYCATGTLPDPCPWARRSPPPPHARDLVRFSPQPGQPTSWLHDSTSSTRTSGVRATPIRRKPSKPTSRSHRPSDTE